MAAAVESPRAYPSIGYKNKVGLPCVDFQLDGGMIIIMSLGKILIVDDSADIVEMMSRRLTAQGYEVVSALDSQKALEIAITQKPDIILLDVIMPGLDGISVGRRLRQDPATKKIPIIMVTAKGEREDVVNAIKNVGAVEYIIKPFRIETLLEKIGFVLTKPRH